MSHAVCAPASALFDLSAVHVLTVERGPRSSAPVVESAPSLAGCPSCGVLDIGRDRRQVLLHDLPCAGVPVRVTWRKRTYRCPDSACEVPTFSASLATAVFGGTAALANEALIGATNNPLVPAST